MTSPQLYSTRQVSASRYRLCRGTRCGILTVLQYVESLIVRDDCVQTRAAVDLVFHPVGRSDGVVPIAAEDLLPSSPKVHHTSEPTSVNAVDQRAWQCGLG